MPRTATSSCPVCGGTMEKGFFAAESYLGGAKWVAHRTRLAVGGKAIARPDAWGNVYLAGFRCPRCRYLGLRY